MGRPKKDPLAGVLGDTGPITREEMDLDEFLEDIAGGTASIHILRMKTDGGRPQVGKCTMEDLREDPYEYIRVNYGPGKYLLMFRSSERRIAATRQIEVEGGKPSGPVVGPSGGGMSSIFPADMPFQDKLLLMRFFMPEKPAIDFGAIMAGMGGMMTALRPTPDPNVKLPDPIQMFQTIMQMYQGMKDKNEKSPLEQLREVAGVIKEFSGDKESPTSGIDSPWGMVTEIGKQVVSTVGPALAGMVPGAAARPAVINPQPAPRPALTPGPRQPSDTGNPDPTHGRIVSAEENLHQWLLSQIAFLKVKAKAGKDPGFWVDYVFENADEPGCQALLYTLRHGATFENLLEFDAEIAQNPQLSIWFNEVFQGVKAGLLQTDVDSGGEGRNAGDNQPNAGARTPGQPNGTSPGTSPSVS